MPLYGPMSAYGTPGINPHANAPEPFLWGRGGSRMSADDIALQRRLAASQLAQGADFSPVQHWAQGAARAFSGLLGGLQMRRADAAAAANTAESDAVLRELMASDSGAAGSKNAVAAALVNPNVSDEVRSLATMMWRDQHENPTQPYRFEDNAGNVYERDPTTGENRLIFTDPNDKIFMQDGQMVTVPNRVRAGGAPVAPPPEAIAELRADPSAAAEFDQVFGAGAAARALGGQGGPASQAPGGFPAGQR
jgi:hypothetical protein